MDIVTPVILSGGSGTRLWPLSRKSYPKQFTQLTGDSSLFQASAQRLTGRDSAGTLERDTKGAVQYCTFGKATTVLFGKAETVVAVHGP